MNSKVSLSEVIFPSIGYQRDFQILKSTLAMNNQENEVTERDQEFPQVLLKLGFQIICPR